MRLILLLGLASLVCAAPNRIVFSRIGPDALTLFIANADGSGERPLLKSEALDYDPAWSPDGSWIVFTSERDGSADLYRVRPDGSAMERITDDPAYDDQAAFSPDGNRVVFVSTRGGGRANLWIVDLRDRKSHALTSGSGGDFRPSWSPDGKWIAFSSDRGSTLPMAKGRWEHLHIVDVYLMHPDGTGLRRITQHGDFCGSPRWSSDSSRVVAYCMSAEETWPARNGAPTGATESGLGGGGTQIVSIDVLTGASTPVQAGPGLKMSPALLPSGEVAYIRKDMGAPGLFYGQGKLAVAGRVRSPSWSPDGSRMVYHKIGSYYSHDWRKIWSRDADYELVSTRWLPAIDPAGTRIVGTDFQKKTLNVVDIGSEQSHVVYQKEGVLPMAGQWTPKGDAIVFGAGTFFVNRERGAQVAMIQPDGSGYHEITSGANNNGFPSMSPDGQRFVYRTVGPEGEGLRIKNLEDGSVTKLTTDYDNFPLWSPRGDLILFTRKVDGDFEVFTIRPDGTQLKRLTNSPGNEGHCAWSPDGEWILFSTSRMGFKDEAPYTDSPQPYGEVFVMRFDGTGVKQLTDNQWEDAGPAWLPRTSISKR
jgi:Tol biopolymer transport system component